MASRADESIRRATYSGMNDRGILLSRIKFSGIIRLWEISRHWKERYNDEPLEYFTVSDEFGMKFILWDKKIEKTLEIGEKYCIEGDVKVGKGSIFLSISKMYVFSGADFRELA